MTEKSPFDLDRALDALAARMREVGPRPNDRLRARVLEDAARVTAERKAQGAAGAATAAAPRAGSVRSWLSGFADAWSGAAVAAVLLGLIAGLGVGYEAGAELMAEAGFGEPVIASVARDGDGLFIPEDVL